MLPFLPDPIKWVVFTNEERAVLIEAFSIWFPAAEKAQAPCFVGQNQDYSEGSELSDDEIKLASFLSIRGILVQSLSEGPNAVIGLTVEDRETLSAFVMQGIAGYYDYLMSLDEKMASVESNLSLSRMIVRRLGSASSPSSIPSSC